jgi:hypothetical protein
MPLAASWLGRSARNVSADAKIPAKTESTACSGRFGGICGRTCSTAGMAVAANFDRNVARRVARSPICGA